MDLSSEIKNNNIVLLIVPKESYHSKLVESLKAIENSATKICYICVNEPYSFVVDNIKKNSLTLEKFFFIDTLTKKVQQPPPADNCEFVSAPNALTEISLAFSKALNEKKCDSMVFDTLSTLLVYEKPHSIIQFIHSIMTKLRIASGKAVFIALKEDLQSELVKDLYMFVDKVLDLSG